MIAQLTTASFDALRAIEAHMGVVPEVNVWMQDYLYVAAQDAADERVRAAYMAVLKLFTEEHFVEAAAVLAWLPRPSRP